MSFLKLPFLWLWRILTLGAGSQRIKEVSSRIHRYGDRFRNAGDHNKAQLSQRYASIARHCFTAPGAIAVEGEFLELIGVRKAGPASIIPVERSSDTPGNEGWFERERDRGWAASSSSADSFSSSDNGSTSNSTDADTSGQGGEFGGAGASASWNDNS